MKKQDKFEEYLRKEMDSMQYDGEDRMWEGFKGQLPAATPLEQLITWSIPLAVVGLVGLGVFWYSGSQIADTSLTGKDETTLRQVEKTSEISQETTSNILTEDYEENEKLQDQKESRIEDDLLKINTVENAQLGLADTEKEKYSKQNTTTKKKSKLPRANKRNKVSDLGTGVYGQERNLERSETRQHSNPLNLQTQTAQHSKSTHSQLGQNVSGLSIRQEPVNELVSHTVVSPIDFLEAKESLLIMKENEELSTLKPSEGIKKRQNSWAGFLGAAAGAQAYQLYSVGVNYSQPISKLIDLNISLGGQSELGNIVSQDSIVKEIGPAIVETRTNKDLNDLTSIYLSAVPLFRIGQFGIGIGPRVSYGVLNRFNIDEIQSAVNSPDFNVVLPISTIGATYTAAQDWESLNRMRFGGDLILHYQSPSRFGIQLHLSKNFNELIKDNLAVTNKSNSPLTIGLQLNYIILN